MSGTSTCTKLVDRDRQLSRLDDLFAECVTGRSQVTFVRGPVGTGKTALLGEFTERVRTAGATVLSATASCSEQALPLGVVDQLIYSSGLLDGMSERIEPLAADLSVDSWHSAMLGADPQQNARALRRLCAALIDLARVAPMVVVIDDAQHADLPSQHFLASLMLRLRGSKAMMLLADGYGMAPPCLLVHAALRRDWHERPIEVGPLSRESVAELLNRQPNLEAAWSADAAYALTGGNPLLLRALIDDSLPAAPGPAGPLAPGKVFAEAFRESLYSAGPVVLRVAQGVAVLAESGGSSTPAQLLHTAGETVNRATQLLDRAGLLDGTRFRHPRARAAVIESMRPEEVAAMHAEAAQLAHKGRMSALDVSRHLLLADRIEAEWAVPVLVAAAEQALAGGDPDHAVACLQQSEAACEDSAQQTEILSMLARATWRSDPGKVRVYLPELMAAAHGGLLDRRQSAALVQYLLWHNHLNQAMVVLDLLCEDHRNAPESAGQGAPGGLDSALLWMLHAYPRYADRVAHYRTLLGRDAAVARTRTASQSLADALEAVRSHGAVEDAATTAEQVLHRLRLDDDSWAPAMVAFSLLLLAGRTETAAFWCDSLLAGAPAGAAGSSAPTWQAMLLAVRAEIAVKRGDVQAAMSDALTALTALSAKGWGLAIGSVLSTLVLAATETGNCAAAEDFLSVPLPTEMTWTPFGLGYLHARGSYYLANDRIGDALIDFQQCADTMRDVGLDQPGLVPWRTATAQAYLAADRQQYLDRAGNLAAEQIALLGPGQRQPRVRGISLRVLARASGPQQCLVLLREAVELLERSGDRLEVARAYADLSDAFKRAGESGNARLTLRTARGIAKECQATALLCRLGPGTGATGDTSTQPPSTTAELSEAERRVVGLAALGHSNREIAESLWVTVSTVEQHLTRVYRKLGITRRSDLPSGLTA